jgi:hypothetical protein
MSRDHRLKDIHRGASVDFESSEILAELALHKRDILRALSLPAVPAVRQGLLTGPESVINYVVDMLNNSHYPLHEFFTPPFISECWRTARESGHDISALPWRARVGHIDSEEARVI